MISVDKWSLRQLVTLSPLACWCVCGRSFFLHCCEMSPARSARLEKGGSLSHEFPNKPSSCDRPLSTLTICWDSPACGRLSDLAGGSPAKSYLLMPRGVPRTLVPTCRRLPSMITPVMGFRGLLRNPTTPTVQFHQYLHSVESRVQHLHITARPTCG